LTTSSTIHSRTAGPHPHRDTGPRPKHSPAPRHSRTAYGLDYAGHTGPRPAHAHSKLAISRHSRMAGRKTRSPIGTARPRPHHNPTSIPYVTRLGWEGPGIPHQGPRSSRSTAQSTLQHQPPTGRRASRPTGRPPAHDSGRPVARGRPDLTSGDLKQRPSGQT